MSDRSEAPSTRSSSSNVQTPKNSSRPSVPEARTRNPPSGIKGARNFPEARISAASWAGVITSVEFAAAGGSTLDAPIFSIVGNATDGAIGADSAGLSGATSGACLTGGAGKVCCAATV